MNRPLASLNPHFILLAENLILHMLSEESQQQQRQSLLTPHREGRSATPPASVKSASGQPPRPASPALTRKTPGGTAVAGKAEERTLTMQIAQMLLSSLHAWGLDPDLDHLCVKKLGLLRPAVSWVEGDWLGWG